MKLISMSDFVFECRKNEELDNIRSFWACESYAKFLKTPLTLGMFVPCDKYGNVLSDPELTIKQGDGFAYYSALDEDFKKYQEAEERVLFEGVSFEDAEFIVSTTKTIEGLVNEYSICFNLTPTVIKQIGI